VVRRHPVQSHQPEIAISDHRDRDPKELVRESYDQISYAYRGDSLSRDRGYFRWIDVLTPFLRPDDSVLDLGCGCGVPVAQELATTCRVTGVDFSATQIARAQALVPTATFLCQDITQTEFPPASFTAIVSFFALIHIPLAEQPVLFPRLFAWLEPGGYLMLTVGHRAWTGYADDWHGAPVYWSHADEATYVGWIRDAGFTLVQSDFIPEGDGGHSLLLAQRPPE
jgi:SAM-dependent methyltransferase